MLQRSLKKSIVEMMNSPIAGAHLDEGAIAHFGSLTSEQKQLVEHSDSSYAFVPRSVLKVTGKDALSWLDSLTSQKIDHLKAGESSETLILSPQGRVEHQLKVIVTAQALWLVIEQSDAQVSEDWLKSMIFMKDVIIDNVSKDYRVLASLTSDGGELADKAIGIWVDQWGTIVPGGYQYGAAREEEQQWQYSELLVPATVTPEHEVGVDAFNTLRIMAGRPRFGAETDEKTLPHEVNWLKTAVHLNKGCYRGQETVAKVHNVGHPPRRLTLLHIDGSEHVIPEIGQEVLYQDKPVGKITSRGFHHEAGPIALALIKRTVPVDATLQLTDGIACSQETIVPASAGATVNIPRGEFLHSEARRPLL
ncbi:MAG: folate-binding protein [Micrococcaceae bacterium]